MRLNNKGFTLIEMIIVMVLFMVIIIITTDTFSLVLKQTSKLFKSEESNITGVLGLELLRHDLEQAGFGLADTYDPVTPIQYKEAGYLPAKTYNDAPSGLPRAFVLGNDTAAVADPNSYSGVKYTTLAGTDYLSIKATSIGTEASATKWTYLMYSSSGKASNLWKSSNLAVGDKIISLRKSFTSLGTVNQLAYDTTAPTAYWTSYNTSKYTTPFSPANSNEIFYQYGLTSGADVGMPFNRADYFVATPSDATKIPVACAQGTGILYRSFVNHDSTSGGKLTYMPILDCVADMQVILGWDLTDTTGSIVSDPTTTGDGQIDTWSNADGTVVAPATNQAAVVTALASAGQIHTKLKTIKVYILAQVGKKDTSYISSNPITIGDAGEASFTKPAGFNLSAQMLNYRWKVYRLIINPKNLITNQ